MAALENPPIALFSFTFSGNSMASQYMLESQLSLLAPGQTTIPKGEKGYCGILNQEGMALLYKTQTQLHTAKATVKGELMPARTGAKKFPDGSQALCSWQNRVFNGVVVESDNSAAVGKFITTSSIILYEIDSETGQGWILTSKGSIYIVSGK